MKDQETFIDQFFNRELNQEELVEFKNRLEADTGFREEVQFRKNLHKVVAKKEATEKIEKAATIKKLKALQSQSATGKDVAEAPQAKVRNLGRWLTAVAAIGALILIGYLGFKDGLAANQNLTADFYNNNYTPYEADITLKSIPSNTLITELDIAYKNKDYTASINLANSILKELPNDAEILLIKGVSLLEKKKLDESLAVFNSISNELYSDEANWYAGMVLLKQNKIDAAKTRFQKIKGNKYLKKVESLN
ncbi:MAG: tol-pal system YbgF family protein [Saprospiraceae bacterium]